MMEPASITTPEEISRIHALLDKLTSVRCHNVLEIENELLEIGNLAAEMIAKRLRELNPGQVNNVLSPFLNDCALVSLAIMALVVVISSSPVLVAVPVLVVYVLLAIRRDNSERKRLSQRRLNGALKRFNHSVALPYIVEDFHSADLLVRRNAIERYLVILSQGDTNEGARGGEDLLTMLDCVSYDLQFLPEALMIAQRDGSTLHCPKLQSIRNQLQLTHQRLELLGPIDSVLNEIQKRSDDQAETEKHSALLRPADAPNDATLLRPAGPGDVEERALLRPLE